jgi:hypothetical protein
LDDYSNNNDELIKDDENKFENVFLEKIHNFKILKKKQKQNKRKGCNSYYVQFIDKNRNKNKTKTIINQNEHDTDKNNKLMEIHNENNVNNQNNTKLNGNYSNIENYNSNTPNNHKNEYKNNYKILNHGKKTIPYDHFVNNRRTYIEEFTVI